MAQLVRKYSRILTQLILISVSLTSCTDVIAQVGTELPREEMPPTQETVTTPEATKVVRATVEPAEITSSPIPSSSEPVAGQGTSNDSCPKKASSSIVNSEVIFYYQQDKSRQIISVSTDNEIVEIFPGEEIFDEFSSNNISLSADGTLLAIKAGDTLFIQNLETHKDQSAPWLEDWKTIVGWDQTNNLLILTKASVDINAGKFVREYTIVDPSDLTINREAVELDLEGIILSSTDPWGGFAVLDPERALILYTVQADDGYDVILKDISTGEVVWRGMINFWGSVFTPPSWSEDGGFVTFAVFTHQAEYFRLVQLSRKGTSLIELHDGPLDKPANYQIRYILSSPDALFVHYALWNTSSEGPGYILNRETQEIRSICSDNGEDFIRGYWIPGDGRRLLYLVRLETGELEARLLDIPSWQYKSIIVINEADSLEFLGVIQPGPD